MADHDKAQAGDKLQHTAVVHSHDHWHVTHVHSGHGPNDFEHRSTYHSHEHNHAGYEYETDKPEQHQGEDHGAKAHVHDHAGPTGQAG